MPVSELAAWMWSISVARSGLVVSKTLMFRFFRYGDEFGAGNTYKQWSWQYQSRALLYSSDTSTKLLCADGRSSTAEDLTDLLSCRYHHCCFPISSRVHWVHSRPLIVPVGNRRTLMKYKMAEVGLSGLKKDKWQAGRYSTQWWGAAATTIHKVCGKYINRVILILHIVTGRNSMNIALLIGKELAKDRRWRYEIHCFNPPCLSVLAHGHQEMLQRARC